MSRPIDDTGTFVGDRPNLRDLRTRAPRDFRRRLFESARTAAWVIPLTLMIWLYAEREQLNTVRLTVPIVLRSNDPNRVITPNRFTVSVDVRGPRGNIEELRRRLTGERDAIELDVDRSPGSDHEMQFSALLSDKNSPLARDGMSVIKVEPPTQIVYVDSIVEIEQKVVAPPLDARVEEIVFEPSSVRISGPQRRIAELRGRTPSLAIAEMAGLRDLSTPGTHADVSVPIRPLGEGFKLMPPTVTTNFRVVEERTRQFKLRSVIIYVSKPVAIEGRFVVTMSPPVLQNIEIKGPVNIIEAMERDPTGGANQVIAVLRIDQADITATRGSKAVKFDAPPGVEVLPPYPTVDFTIRDGPAGE